MNAPSAEYHSGKNADSENFPVASILIAKHLRPHITHFYNFARTIDDVADNPDMHSALKLSILAGFSDALKGTPSRDPSLQEIDFSAATNIRHSLIDTNVPIAHCQNLITAFCQDATKNRYDTWDSLVDYCLLSAAPVGRYLIDLHGGIPKKSSTKGYAASDALCIALQVINHLQDCKDDFLMLDRVYIPGDWLDAENVTGVEALSAGLTAPSLRRVFDRVLVATEAQLDLAKALPHYIPDRRLAMEASVIWQIAKALCVKLRHNDPLAASVTLSKPALLWCTIKGIVASIIKRDIVH